MAKTIIVRLVDDLEGGEADETVFFGLDGKNYEIDLSAKNAASLRKVLDPYISKANAAGRATATPRATTRSRQQRTGSGPTLYSGLSAEEKESFRSWANMPDARRIGDKRVQSWIDAGKP